MKKIILSTIYLLIFPTLVFADFVVLYEKNTGAIVNFSDSEKNFVIADSDKDDLAILRVDGDAKDYYSQAAINDYKLVDKKLVLNVKKINDRETVLSDDLDRQEEYNAVNKRARKLAYESLVAEGFKFKYITEDVFK